jgi:hypothetical protein
VLGGPLNINNKGRRLTRLRIGVTHIPLPNITIVTQKDRKLEIGHGNKSEYTVQMYLEVLCKLCFDNTITKSNEDRVLVLLRELCQTLQTKHWHKCLISDVKEAGTGRTACPQKSCSVPRVLVFPYA